MLVLPVQTEWCCPTVVWVSGSGPPPPTMWQKTDHYYNKDFSLSPYLHIESTFPWTTLEGQLSLGTGTGGRAPPLSGPVAARPAASGVVGRLLQAFEGELAPVRGVGAWGAAGVGAVRRSRVFGRVGVRLFVEVLVRIGHTPKRHSHSGL